MSRLSEPWFVWGSPPYYRAFTSRNGEVHHLAAAERGDLALCGRTIRPLLTVTTGIDYEAICLGCRRRLAGGHAPVPEDLPTDRPLQRVDHGSS